MSSPILIATLMRPKGDTGVQTHFHALMAYLQETGRQYELVTPYNSPLWQVYPVFGLRKLANLFDWTLGVWWYRYWHAYFLRQALKHRLQSDAACVVYAQCPLSAEAALRARVSNKQRVVMVVHFNISQADEWAGKGLIPNGGGLYRSIRAFEARVLPGVDGLVFVSEFMRGELQRLIPAVGQVRSEVIPNFLSDPGEATLSAERNDLITIGTLEHRKNQSYALEIVHAAAQLGRTLSLTLVGAGPDRAMLEGLARKLGVERQVLFKGFVANAAALMPAHRACLHVAHMENLPLTLIEALSRGLPVFAPDVGGIPDVFREGEEGRFIPLDDANSAARIILDWMDSEMIMEKARIAARKRYLDCFETSRIAEKLTNFLKDAPKESASGKSVKND
jgi:glycosyltransferase involved in cell wall biosynthesis